MLDGAHSQHFFRTGVIIYHSQEMGLVVVDKNTIAISASDVVLSFAAFPVEIPGEISRCEDWDKPPDLKKYFVQFFGMEEMNISVLNYRRLVIETCNFIKLKFVGK